MEKNKRIKTDIVFHLTLEEATLSKMPKYNGYKCGYGIQGDKKYNRNKEKKKFLKENW